MEREIESDKDHLKSRLGPKRALLGQHGQERANKIVVVVGSARVINL